MSCRCSGSKSYHNCVSIFLTCGAYESPSPTIDRQKKRPLELSAGHGKCFGGYQWSVDVDRSNYLGKVKVLWDGETFMRTCCLFPHDLSTVEIVCEGQHGHDAATGSDNFKDSSILFQLFTYTQMRPKLCDSMFFFFI